MLAGNQRPRIINGGKSDQFNVGYRRSHALLNQIGDPNTGGTNISDPHRFQLAVPIERYHEMQGDKSNKGIVQNRAIGGQFLMHRLFNCCKQLRIFVLDVLRKRTVLKQLILLAKRLAEVQVEIFLKLTVVTEIVINQRPNCQDDSVRHSHKVVVLCHR